MQYKLLSSMSMISLQENVQRHLDSVWELQGGVTVTYVSYMSTQYMQAVITNSMSEDINRLAYDF